MISKEPLEDIYIKLKCGHCFNYSSIYNEIIKQKTIKNYKETQKLHKDSIKCPYCRTVQDKLLPYNPQFKKIRLVNWPPVKYGKSYLKNKCSYKFKSGKRKGMLCNIQCNDEYCRKHLKLLLNHKNIKKNINKNKKKINA